MLFVFTQDQSSKIYHLGHYCVTVQVTLIDDASDVILTSDQSAIQFYQPVLWIMSGLLILFNIFFTSLRMVHTNILSIFLIVVRYSGAKLAC